MLSCEVLYVRMAVKVIIPNNLTSTSPSTPVLTSSPKPILSYRIKCASTYHVLQSSLLFVTCDVLLITSSKTFSSGLLSLENLLMAEQAQSDAGDLDGLQDGPQDAPQDPTNLPTQDPYTRLMKELNEPDTPPPRKTEYRRSSIRIAPSYYRIY